MIGPKNIFLQKIFCANTFQVRDEIQKSDSKPVVQQTVTKEETKNIYLQPTSVKDDEKEESTKNAFKGVSFVGNSQNSNNNTNKFSEIFAPKNTQNTIKGNGTALFPKTTENSSTVAQNPFAPQNKPSNFGQSGAKPAEEKPVSIFAPKSGSNAPSIFNFNKPAGDNSKPAENKSVFQFSKFSNAANLQQSPGEKKPPAADDKELSVSVAQETLDEPNATLIFHAKAMLSMFYPAEKEWRQRGVGNFKVLIPDSMKGQKVVQFVLKRKPYNKLSINCIFSAEDKFVPINNNHPAMTSFVTVDDSDGTSAQRYFYVRFQNPETLEKFKKTVLDVTQG